MVLTKNGATASRAKTDSVNKYILEDAVIKHDVLAVSIDKKEAKPITEEIVNNELHGNQNNEILSIISGIPKKNHRINSSNSFDNHLKRAPLDAQNSMKAKVKELVVKEKRRVSDRELLYYILAIFSRWFGDQLGLHLSTHFDFINVPVLCSSNYICNYYCFREHLKKG
jgi:hypothetical protein